MDKFGIKLINNVHVKMVTNGILNTAKELTNVLAIVFGMLLTNNVFVVILIIGQVLHVYLFQHAEEDNIGIWF